VEPRLSFVTLGVSDLGRATRFYADGLRLQQLKSLPTVSFFDLGGVRLALYPRHLLEAETGVAPDDARPSGFALGYNVGSEPEVDRLLSKAERAGGRITKRASRTDWGGYAGYCADPDGFLWEVVWNPKLSSLATTSDQQL
jgi:catechol 2,3-dioxygenase-like lactoylglutathione lyase family enzyme